MEQDDLICLMAAIIYAGRKDQDVRDSFYDSTNIFEILEYEKKRQHEDGIGYFYEREREEEED